PGGATSPDDRGHSIAWHDATLYLAGLVGGSLPSQIDLVGTPSGPPNAFVTALDSAGTRLIYSVALGGTRTDGALGLAVDGGGNVSRGGGTTPFPRVGPGGVGKSPFPPVNAFQLDLAGGFDAFVTKIPYLHPLVYTAQAGDSLTLRRNGANLELLRN